MTQTKIDNLMLQIENTINLSTPPQPIAIPNRDDKTPVHIAFGDAHGNWYKIIHNAFSYGLFTTDNPDFLNKIRALYDTLNHSALTKEQFEDYLKLLESCTVTLGMKQIFLGDTLCDRGQNDMLTLAWVAHLDKQQAPFRIIFSNHDFDGISSREMFNKYYKNYDPYTKLFFVSRFNMEQFLENNPEFNELYSVYQKVYMNHLQLVDYTVTHDKHIILYTHAGCGMETIEGLAEFYDVTYNEASIPQLIEAIDNINSQFKKHLTSSQFDWSLLEQYSDKFPNLASHLFNIIASRHLRVDFRDQPSEKAYYVDHIHGHNDQQKYLSNIPVYSGAFPFSKPVPTELEQRIKQKKMFLLVHNTEETDSPLYFIGMNNWNQIKLYNFIELIHTLIKEEVLKGKLLKFISKIKTQAGDNQFKLICLDYIFLRAPVIMDHMKKKGFDLFYQPSSSLTSLDTSLGKFHSITNQGKTFDCFYQTHPTSIISGIPLPSFHRQDYPEVHEESAIKKRARVGLGLFDSIKSEQNQDVVDQENCDPNNREQTKDNEHKTKMSRN
jgi:hypothetical protein